MPCLNRRLDSRTLNRPVLVVVSAKVFQSRSQILDRLEVPDPQGTPFDRKLDPKAFGDQARGVVWVDHSQKGGGPPKWSTLRTTTTPFSQRAEPSPFCLGTSPKRRSRRGTTSIFRVRCDKTKRGCASRVPAGRTSSRRRIRHWGQQSRGSGQADHSSPTGNDGHLEDRGLYPPCPTRGTSRLPAGRRFLAESIRSDSTIDASIHGQEGPPKSDSKRWV